MSFASLIADISLRREKGKGGFEGVGSWQTLVECSQILEGNCRISKAILTFSFSSPTTFCSTMGPNLGVATPPLHLDQLKPLHSPLVTAVVTVAMALP